MTLTLTTLSGNPRRGSRTLAVAEATAARITALLNGRDGLIGAAGLDTAIDDRVIELADLAGQLFAPEHPEADEALARVAGSDVLVVATPVYKASYTGLLKSFLDLYGANGLRGVVALPVVVSGNPAHLLSTDIHLRSLLVELGASVPTRGLGLVESQLGTVDDVLDAWFTDHGDLLHGAVTAGARAGAAA
ncbi:NADPH-dependent oxidoreductase [Occultella glacieicola]|uniref:NADPH-dependent oxidoreductase n=1 Tax=Occultella glacieicola TaxID=2518684 RepID=A0ABY2DZB3_9MICO|nr:NAD(P)H-dependent oxidoreductase [Occultella glacieicola]TDE89695.1 NADPH-dependent oxidoreductase [Occultella glacieicola]